MGKLLKISRTPFRKFASLALICLFTCIALHPDALAQQSPVHRHGNTMTGKPVELGVSAAVDRQGRLWAVAKEITADGKPAVALRSSVDMGKSWSAPQHIAQEPVAARGDERPKVAFGANGEIYVLYTRPAPGFKNPHIGDIRFVRSTDGGETFSEPVTVHANRDVIVHAFGSMIVDKAGNIYLAWIDGRNREAAKAKQEPYAGNALYYAVSTDSGKTFKGDYKIADQTCECCRVSLALNEHGHAVVMWRHIFAPNIRDHALAELKLEGRPGALIRATFDDWRIDACPHHGPSVVYAPDGKRHQVWFNGKEGAGGGVQYAATTANGKLGKPVSLGSAQASHADVAVHGKQVAIVWKEFNGQATAIRAKLSNDGGASWQDKELATTYGDADKPYLMHTRSGIVLIWHTRNEGLRVIRTTTGA